MSLVKPLNNHENVRKRFHSPLKFINLLFLPILTFLVKAIQKEFRNNQDFEPGNQIANIPCAKPYGQVGIRDQKDKDPNDVSNISNHINIPEVKAKKNSNANLLKSFRRSGISQRSKMRIS